MELSEVKEKKATLERKVSEAMSEFEKETGLRLSDIGFVRRTIYREDTCIEDGFVYAVETRIEL